MEKLLVELKVKKVDGIIVDLCNNGGGVLIEVIVFFGLFIISGFVV